MIDRQVRDGVDESDGNVNPQMANMDEYYVHRL